MTGDYPKIISSPALSHDSTEKHKQSQSYSRRSLKIAQVVGNRELQAEALYVLAWSLHSVDESTACIKYCKRLLEMAKEVQNRELETEAYDLLGQSYHLTSKFQESVEYGELSLIIAKAVKNIQLEKEARIFQDLSLKLNRTGWYHWDEPDQMFLDDSEKEVSFYPMSGMDVSMQKTNFQMIYK